MSNIEIKDFPQGTIEHFERLVVKAAEKYDGYYLNDYINKVAIGLHWFSFNYLEQNRQTDVLFHEVVTKNLIDSGYFVEVSYDERFEEEYTTFNNKIPSLDVVVKAIWDTWNYDTDPHGYQWEFDEPIPYPYDGVTIEENGFGSKVVR